MATHRFTALLELHGKTATGFEVPADVVAAMGSGKKPQVLVTINAHSYRSTVAVYGSQFMLPLSAANRQAAGVEAGQLIDVGLDRDDAPRTVTIPDALAEALRACPGASEAFDRWSFTKRREAVESVESAKREDTRQRRIASIVDRATSQP